MPTFYDRFRECVERWPSKTALEIQRREGIESYTYSEARQMAESIGHWLRENGFHSGARLAIYADNHPRWVTAYLGAIAAGCTAVPLDTAFHADQVAKLLKDSGSSLLFADAKHWTVAQQAVDGLPVKLVMTSATAEVAEQSAKLPDSPLATDGAADLDSIFAAGSAEFIPADVPGENLASLLYTSGTTADPKGVMLTHGNLLGEVAAISDVIKLGPDDKILGLLPLFHVLSQMANLLFPLVYGCTVVYLETLNTTELLRALQEREISIFCVVPQFFYLIHERVFKEIAQRGKLTQRLVRALMTLNRTLRRFGINAGPVLFKKVHHVFGPKMRHLVTGGSRFDPQIARDFEDFGIEILQAYGLTETTGGAFLNPPGEVVIGSVGQALGGVQGKILDPQPQEEGGQPVGEIAIRGPIVMKGYWNRPEATADVLKDGWLLTGDLGRFDSDGNLFITGRRKEVIVLSNGKNVYPEEIEAHYAKSPFIKEICVVGLEGGPNDANSNKLYAVIVPNLETLRQRKIVNMREVIRFDIEGLSPQLPSTKRISGYEIWQEDLPRTTTRKLKRFEIEKRVRANQSQGSKDDAELTSAPALTAEESAWLERPEVGRALNVIRDSAKASPEKIRPGDNLELDLGLDSMQRVELLVAVEQELGGDVEESKLAEIYTVREFVDAILESAASGKTPSRRTESLGWEALLQEQPTDPEILNLARPQRGVERMWFAVTRLIEGFSQIAFRLQVKGLEKLPAKASYIISSNHQSYLDPVIMGSVFPWRTFRDLFAVGTSDIFGSGPMRTLAKWLRVVVVDPDSNLVSAMRAGAFGLRHGRVLILYPEGERSIDGSPRIFKKGASILAIHLQVPIVPVAIDGFHDAWPRNKSFQKFARLKITFGAPIPPPPKSEASEAAYEQLTATLKERVAEMWEELRQGK